MEFINYAIKPIPFSPDPPEVSVSIAASIKQRCLTLKPTNSRYDTWSEDVHAAFMEAVNIYPPMGKRKQGLRHISISQDNTDDDVVSSLPEQQFGRCQLIQLYILEKTGKNRTRKQVSSHLQYLERSSRKRKRKRPPKRASFHDTSRLTQEPPERDSPVSSPEGSQSPDTTPPMSLSFCQASPSDDMLSIVRRASEEQEPGATAAHGTCSTYYVDNGCRSSSAEPHRVFDPTITPLRLPPWTTMGRDSSDMGYELSLPSGRLGNNLSPLTWEEEPTNVYSSQVHLSPEYQVLHHAARNNSKFTTMDSLCSCPLTLVDEPYFAPLQSSQIMRFERQTVAPDNFDRSCHLLHTSGSLLHLDSYTFHTSTTDLPPISIPLSSFSDIQSSPFYTGMSDFLLDHKSRYRAPKLLPYSDDTTPYAQLADPQLSDHPRCGHAEEQLALASPLLFKPNPRYPAAYAYTEDSTLEPSPVPTL